MILTTDPNKKPEKITVADIMRRHLEGLGFAESSKKGLFMILISDGTSLYCDYRGGRRKVFGYKKGKSIQVNFYVIVETVSKIERRVMHQALKDKEKIKNYIPGGESIVSKIITQNAKENVSD